MKINVMRDKAGNVIVSKEIGNVVTEFKFYCDSTDETKEVLDLIVSKMMVEPEE